MGKLKSLVLPSKKLVWLMFILISLTLESVALIFQYVLDYPPCVVCIHIRLLVATFLMFACLGLWVRSVMLLRIVNLLALLGVCAISIERSWLLLGTERGFIFASCGFDLGLPTWLALDEWLPFLFKVHTSCGYTPEIAFGFTMAEVLLAFFSIMALSILYLLLLVAKPAD
ncbi:MAG: disulfide bond formation protein B [Cycloclasticus sp.]|nr:disulfide bond formation protein B [Cycloclasticus sp.]